MFVMWKHFIFIFAKPGNVMKSQLLSLKMAAFWALKSSKMELNLASFFIIFEPSKSIKKVADHCGKSLFWPKIDLILRSKMKSKINHFEPQNRSFWDTKINHFGASKTPHFWKSKTRHRHEITNLIDFENTSFSKMPNPASAWNHKIQDFWAHFELQNHFRAGKENHFRAQKSKSTGKENLRAGKENQKFLWNRAKMTQNRLKIGQNDPFLGYFCPFLAIFGPFRPDFFEIDGTGRDLGEAEPFVASLLELGFASPTHVSLEMLASLAFLARGSITLPSFASLMSLP